MVVCDRCHRKFGTYSALLQHYNGKHPNAGKPAELESRIAAERELERYRATIHSRGSSHAKLVVFFIVLILAAGVIGYVALAPRDESGTKGVSVGMAAPEFTLPEISGQTFTLSSYRGKSNVLIFFHEGLACAPCIRQMADLEQLNPQFAQLDIILVSITGDPLHMLAEWATSTGVRHGKVLSDQDLSVSKLYDMLGPDVSMMPGSAPGHSFILVDKSGVIKWRQDYGPSIMYVRNDEIMAAVRRALGE